MWHDKECLDRAERPNPEGRIYIKNRKAKKYQKAEYIKSCKAENDHKAKSTKYIDCCRSVDHVKCSLVTPVNGQRQSDVYFVIFSYNLHVNKETLK